MKNRTQVLAVAWCLVMVSALASPLDEMARDVFKSNETEHETESRSVSDSENYGVLLDAGSSSTKLKVYRWTRPTSSPGVPNINLIDLPKDKRKFKPGLASLDGGLHSVRSYLVRILEAAKETIPVSQHADTPIFVLATAGFRMLGLDGAKECMEVVEELLLNSTLHPFKYTPGSASVLSGEEEAAYSWIAANYLLGFFHENRPDNESVGVLEMGGASTQIAFIPRDPLLAEEFQVILGGRLYSLYVQSYLQFGMTAITNRVESDLVQAHSCDLQQVDQPCLLSGDSRNVTCGNKKILLQGTGAPTECRSIFDQLVATAPPKKCYLEPCSIGSVFLPSVEDMDFYAISAFLYAPRSLGAVRSNGELDLQNLWDKAKQYCGTTFSSIPANKRKFASSDCMGAIYINELLTKPYGFPPSTKRINASGKIDGNDIEWALGAMLELLSLSFTGDPYHCSLTRR